MRQNIIDINSYIFDFSINQATSIYFDTMKLASAGIRERPGAQLKKLRKDDKVNALSITARIYILFNSYTDTALKGVFRA